MKRLKLFLTISAALVFLITAIDAAPLVKIKNITNVAGIRDNQLTGYGLVVGLNGTGDSQKSLFTVNSIANMLKRFGVTVLGSQIQADNVAAVIVTATLPPFGQTGDRIDVTVSAIGDANDLSGGVLLQTPLLGADERIYVAAQGALSIGGFNIRAGASARGQKNHPTVGRVVNGGIIERAIQTNFLQDGDIVLLVQNPDFTTAKRIADAVNASLNSTAARAQNAQKIVVSIPENLRGSEVELLAFIQELEVEPGQTARVVINERTGTVVMGKDVRVSSVAVTHGSLSLKVSVEETITTEPFRVETQRRTDLSVHEQEKNLMVIESGNTIDDVVKALNAIGATPRDVIAILQSLKEAGALHAELVML